MDTLGLAAAKGPTWAWVTVWVVVNLVNVLQAIGFAARPASGMVLNHRLGFAIAALALPATMALVAFARSEGSWLLWLGPAVFDAFVVLMLAVDYIRPVEFRSPARPEILVPYLVLFFGAIALMGSPMFRENRGLWGVTAATTVAMLGSMGYAMAHGVG
jgi:hypothetical protein